MERTRGADRPNASTAAATTAGTASSGVPPRPVASSTAVVAAGPRAKPMLPPRANQLIPVAVPPDALRAARDASGW